jgi:demethylmenaquinone methyltransferase/2-methoxy-6-polyprenyl-1,4-benzoquinol methylase
MHKKEEHTTHFGYKTVERNEKQKLVGDVFKSVASKYDIMNDVMSFGLHRIWKDIMVNNHIPLYKNAKILDLAGGTGDITFRMLKKADRAGYDVAITLSDINEAMLAEGKNRAFDKNLAGRIETKIVNAEEIPFPDNSFDIVTIAFGIRNVTDIPKVLSEVHRVLKPGGKFICLEFSNVDSRTLGKIYDVYSFKFIPKFGKLVANDADSYEYLVESIRKFPDADTFRSMITEAGLKKADYTKLNFGVVAIHSGWKI